MKKEELEVVEKIGDALWKIAAGIADPSTSPGPCPSGQGVVNCLTEAMMGCTSGLVQIANAINYLGDTLDRLGDRAIDTLEQK